MTSFLREFSQKIGICEQAASTLEKTYLDVKDTESFRTLSEKIERNEDFAKIAEELRADAEKLRALIEKLDASAAAMKK